MPLKAVKKVKLKLLMSFIWLLLTTSMVAWWLYMGYNIDVSQTPQAISKHQRMILWEGVTLLSALVLGGLFFISYVYKDLERHEKLKLFFANFSHDIKTSISRLKLQGEILKEEIEDSKTLERFLKDLSKLDLQLENSLLLTQVDHSVLLKENIILHKFFEVIARETEALKFTLVGQGHAKADSRALKSIVRNMVDNSMRHGKAQNLKIEILPSNISKHFIDVVLTDDGLGCPFSLNQLGHEMAPLSESSSNGIGLFLAHTLLKKMGGRLEFVESSSKGFIVRLSLPMSEDIS